MKKILLIIIAVSLLSACSKMDEYQKHTDTKKISPQIVVNEVQEDVAVYLVWWEWKIKTSSWEIDLSFDWKNVDQFIKVEYKESLAFSSKYDEKLESWEKLTEEESEDLWKIWEDFSKKTEELEVFTKNMEWESIKITWLNDSLNYELIVHYIDIYGEEWTSNFYIENTETK